MTVMVSVRKLAACNNSLAQFCCAELACRVNVLVLANNDVLIGSGSL